jgi:hypothetical protein
MLRVFLLLFSATALFAQKEPSEPIESVSIPRDFDLVLEPNAVEWRSIPGVFLSKDYLGKTIPGRPTEVRSRWTNRNLYLFYICPFDELNLKPNPDPANETNQLWNWDVAEAFLGSDYEHIGHYKEFEVSPQGEWVDLDINRDDSRAQQGIRWNSGFVVKARIEHQAKVWYAAMRIPWSSIDAREPKAGLELRAGLYRCAGKEPNRRYYAWRPTGVTTFHAPKAFGTLRLR